MRLRPSVSVPGGRDDLTSPEFDAKEEMRMRKGYIGTVLLGLVVAGTAWTYAQSGGGGALTAQDYVDIQQLYARYN